jgi:hypothetical protein
VLDRRVLGFDKSEFQNVVECLGAIFFVRGLQYLRESGEAVPPRGDSVSALTWAKKDKEMSESSMSTKKTNFEPGSKRYTTIVTMRIGGPTTSFVNGSLEEL